MKILVWITLVYIQYSLLVWLLGEPQSNWERLFAYYFVFETWEDLFKNAFESEDK